MLKLLVISDSHGLEKELIELFNKYKDYTILHLGDYTIDEGILDKYNVIYVRGNCDFFSKAEVERIIEIDGVKIFMTHGHKYNVKLNLLNLVYKSLEVGANFTFFGHTHESCYFKEDGTVFINPGSLKYSRSYVVINDKEVLFERM